MAEAAGILQSSLTSLPDRRRPTADHPKKPGSKQISAVSGLGPAVWGKEWPFFNHYADLATALQRQRQS